MKILIQLNPESFRGTELIIYSDGKIEKTKRVFDQDIIEDLAVDEFKEGSAMEFNLYLKGLAK